MFTIESYDILFILLVDDDLNYPLQREGKGIIIVNEKFKSSGDRKGAAKDKEHLEAIYEKLNINCEDNVHDDLGANDMLDKIELFSKQVKRGCSAIFVSLSTHGGENGDVSGSDDRSVYLQNIIDCFHSNEELLSIPKVFIIQACRGVGVELRYKEADASMEKEKTVNFATKISDTLIAYSMGRVTCHGETQPMVPGS